MFGHSRRPALLTVPWGANGVSQLDEACRHGYDPDIVVPTATVDPGSEAAGRYLLMYADAPWSEGGNRAPASRADRPGPQRGVGRVATPVTRVALNGAPV
jgi:hypothetical protein